MRVGDGYRYSEAVALNRNNLGSCRPRSFALYNVG
jgi:hypothetical protein